MPRKIDHLAVSCPECGASKGSPCRCADGSARRLVHRDRAEKSRSNLPTIKAPGRVVNVSSSARYAVCQIAVIGTSMDCPLCGEHVASGQIHECEVSK